MTGAVTLAIASPAGSHGSDIAPLSGCPGCMDHPAMAHRNFFTDGQTNAGALIRGLHAALEDIEDLIGMALFESDPIIADLDIAKTSPFRIA